MVAALLEAAPALCELCGILLECVTPAACDCCVNCAAVAMEPPLRGRGCGRRVGLVCFAATAGAMLVATAASARLGYFDPAATVGIVEPVNPPVVWQAPPRKRPLEPRPVAVLPGEVGRWTTGADGAAVCDFPSGCTDDPSGDAKEAKEAPVDDAASRSGSKADIAPPADDPDDAAADDDDDDATMDAAKLAPFAGFNLDEPVEPPGCALHLYRHLSKTGGTTLRFIFDKQTAMGDWEFPLIYGFKANEWDALLSRWRAKARAWRDGGGGAGGPRTLVEVRGNWPDNWPAEHFRVVMDDVAELRREFGSATSASAPDGLAACEVTTSLLLREPFAQYLSFYEYYIRKQQEGEVRAEHVGKGWPDVPGKAAWGRDIGEWAARVHDMQTRELLGDKCTGQMRQPGYDVEWVDANAVDAKTVDAEVASSDPAVAELAVKIDGKALRRVGVHPQAPECHAKVTDDDWTRFEKLIDEFDVVGVTERFDEFLTLLARRIGLAHPEYVRSNAGKHERDRGKMSAKVTAVIDAATTMDRAAHELAKTIQSRLVAAAGGDAFVRHVKKFVAQSEERGGRVFVGGVPARSPYKWVRESEAKAAGTTRVTPAAFTDEAGGGQAIAYIVMDPVMLVDASAPHQCVKGCNLDA